MDAIYDIMNMCPTIHEHTTSFDMQSGKDEVLLRHEVETTLRDIVDCIEDEMDDSGQNLETTFSDGPPEIIPERSVVRTLFSDEGYEIGEISSIRPLVCLHCNHSEWSITERIETENGPGDVLHEILPDNGGGLICTSCSVQQVDGGRCCVNCGVNEKLGRRFGLTFRTDTDIFPVDLCCSICDGFYPDISDSPWLNQGFEEYENEELPENNSEKAKKIKKTIGEMGEVLYDLKEKFSEGEYLKMMNLLQMVTNDVNKL